MKAPFADRTPFERFYAFLATCVANADGRQNPELAARLQADFRRQCPDATAEQRERAQTLIDLAAGVRG